MAHPRPRKPSSAAGRTASTRSTFGGAASLLGILLALGGCSVGPKFTKPEAAVPKNWLDPKVAPQSATNTLWWKVFEDPTLDHLIELAYHQNLTLQIAGLRIMEARAALGVVTGGSIRRRRWRSPARTPSG